MAFIVDDGKGISIAAFVWWCANPTGMRLDQLPFKPTSSHIIEADFLFLEFIFHCVYLGSIPVHLSMSSGNSNWDYEEMFAELRNGRVLTTVCMMKKLKSNVMLDLNRCRLQFL
ncbi:hypothetical protein CASFOL_034640 [Castilleja foliolosa]|uniref:Uncharacterized protein n=1 Tax=Castilleja foliolosa TaxID=1961234 RepID=A0ABD3BR75_9LAMI